MDRKPSAPHRATGVAVLAELHVIRLDAAGGGPITEPLPLEVVSSAAGLLEWAQRRELEQVWLHSTFTAPWLTGTPASGYGAPWTVPGWNIAGAHWQHCYRSGPSYDPRPVDVVIPAADTRSPFWSELAPLELWQSLRLFEESVGVRYRRSPAATASRLLRILHDGARHLELEVTEMPPPALVPKNELDPAWLREPLPEETGRPWVVAYDVNAQYLAAASSLRLGVGKVRRLPVGPLYGHGIENVPLYAYGRITYSPPRGLPSPFREGWHWFTTPILELASDLGAHVESSEYWAWDGYARPLESWYRVIREGRGYLIDREQDTCARYALKAVKLMYAHFLGGTIQSTRWEREGDPLFRPDWRHFVMATARANQYRTLVRCADAGRPPFAIATDCLYFLEEGEPGTELASARALRVGRGPGSYKWAGSIPTSNPEAATALYSALRARRRLKKLASAMRSQA